MVECGNGWNVEMVGCWNGWKCGEVGYICMDVEMGMMWCGLGLFGVGRSNWRRKERGCDNLDPTSLRD